MAASGPKRTAAISVGKSEIDAVAVLLSLIFPRSAISAVPLSAATAQRSPSGYPARTSVRARAAAIPPSERANAPTAVSTDSVSDFRKPSGIRLMLPQRGDTFQKPSVPTTEGVEEVRKAVLRLISRAAIP